MFVALNFCPINYSLCGDPEVFEITSLRLMIQWLQTQTFFLPATFLAPDFFFSLFLSTISVLALTFSISIMFLLSISVSLSSVSLSVFLYFPTKEIYTNSIIILIIILIIIRIINHLTIASVSISTVT